MGIRDKLKLAADVADRYGGDPDALMRTKDRIRLMESYGDTPNSRNTQEAEEAYQRRKKRGMSQPARPLAPRGLRDL